MRIAYLKERRRRRRLLLLDPEPGRHAGQACCTFSCHSGGGYWLPEVVLGSARRLDTVEAAAVMALEAPLPLPRVPALGSWRGAVPKVPGGRISTRLTMLADLTRSLLACRASDKGQQRKARRHDARAG